MMSVWGVCWHVNQEKGPDQLDANDSKDKYSLLMHCIKIKSPAKSLLNEQYVFVAGNIIFFVCYHVVPKRHSQLDYE